MRTFLWIMAVLLAAVGAPSARSSETDYTMNFTLSSASTGTELPTFGMVYYTTGAISVTIVWDGQTFSFDDAQLTTLLYPDSTCSGTPGTAALALENLMGCNGYAWWTGYAPIANVTPDDGFLIDTGASTDINVGRASTGSSGNAVTSNGSFTLTPTPEPGTAILWLTGIALMIVTQKRIAHILRPDPGTHASLSPH